MRGSSYSVLLLKLDEFIRKYYKNQLIRGAIYTVGVVAAFYLFSALVEYFGQLSSVGRAILFYSFLLLTLSILVKFIFQPLAGLLKLGKVISHETAAQIIGQHFTDVKDKLINTLQLHQQLEQRNFNEELILASIDQKIVELKPVPFTSAVDLRQNLRYARWAMIPLAVIIVLLLWIPSLLTESSRRIIAYDQVFEPVAPFSFKIVNSKLETPAQQDYELQVKTTGSEIPDQVFIDIEGNKFRLNKADKLNFNYTFRNVQRNISFRFYADGFYSKPYELKSLPNPLLNGFSVVLDYPAYTGKKDETVSNAGDLIIPTGTKVTWNLKTSNTDKLQLAFQDSVINAENSGKDQYAFTSVFKKDNRYRIRTSNQFLQGKDQVEYALSVTQDEYPNISVEEKSDSIASSVLYFKGDMEDDYGFSALKFSFIRKNGNEVVLQKSSDVPFNRNFIRNVFFWTVNFSELQLNPGEEVEYWFEVWDNDGVNGAKSARSNRRLFKAPTLDEIYKQQDEKNTDIKTDLKEIIKDSKQLQKDLDDLNKRMLDKKELSWQDKKKAQELIDKQQQLKQQIENLKKENQLNNQQKEEFRQSDENILEKQKQLENLFEQILSEEMKEKLKQLEELMKNLDKEKLRDAVEKMKQDNKDIEKELDRSLELFKQLELEQKMNAAIDKLDQMQKKQEALAEKSEQKGANEQEIKKEQDQLNKEFDDFRKEMDDVEKKNSQLEEPMNLGDNDKQEQDIQQDMQNSSEELQQKKGSKASKSQKSASSKMQQMKDKMQQQMDASEGESLEEDVSKIREILENLLQLSFDQEKLMKQLQKTNPANPLYTGITAEQKRLKDNAVAIEDSLFALSKRVAQLESFINREISKINNELDKSVEYLAERQVGQAAARQQTAMTSINNLALMLSEVSDQMQKQLAQQQQQQKQGNGSCKKPGNNKKPGQGKPSMSTMRQLQQQLNEQMQQMKEGMGKPGQGKEGKQGSEQLARMAAQQEALRNQLQKMMNEMIKEGDGGNAGNLRNILNKMEQTETEIVNKKLSLETMKRQQEILTRLLEAEKAERERELDTKRESNENKADYRRNILEFNQYNKLMNQEAELLKTLPPSLKPFYKNLVKEYFNTTN
jgi:hypothetical protein